MIFSNQRISYILQALLLILVICGCEAELIEKEKYQPPEWLKGKLYSQIQKEEDLTTFISCLEKTGYDTILNASGSFTVFAPTDQAFEQFKLSHPEYEIHIESPESSPELEALLEYQIIYNSWSKRQFQSSDVNGWIDPDNELDEPRAYKRLSLYREKNKSYPVRNIGENTYMIADSSESNESLIAYTQSNKYCPIFYGDYLNIHELTGKDYEFYFNRSFEAGELYFAGAQLGEEIPAENGFIYKTDRVIAPLPNGEEMLSKGNENYHYSKFQDLVNQFSEFEYNREATLSQVGAEEGLEVDELYNLSYSDLVFNLSNELTGNTNNAKFTYREQHGLLAPTDQAMDDFMNTY